MLFQQGGADPICDEQIDPERCIVEVDIVKLLDSADAITYVIAMHVKRVGHRRGSPLERKIAMKKLVVVGSRLCIVLCNGPYDRSGIARSDKRGLLGCELLHQIIHATRIERENPFAIRVSSTIFQSDSTCGVLAMFGIQSKLVRSTGLRECSCKTRKLAEPRTPAARQIEAAHHSVQTSGDSRFTFDAITTSLLHIAVIRRAIETKNHDRIVDRYRLRRRNSKGNIGKQA